jgi:uncharacterized protein YkwD
MFRKSLKSPLYISIIACVCALSMFLYTLSYSNTKQTTALADTFINTQVVQATNNERTSRGLEALVINSKLEQAAQVKAQNMVEQHYFSHVSPIDGKKWSDFIADVHYEYNIAGENLANGYETVNTLVAAWMASPTHRENILKEEYTETGIALSKGELDGLPTLFVVQVFASPMYSSIMDIDSLVEIQGLDINKIESLSKDGTVESKDIKYIGQYVDLPRVTY